MNTRTAEQIRLHEEVSELANALSRIERDDRLQAFAEAMDMIRGRNVTYESCGCSDWSITLDYTGG